MTKKTFIITTLLVILFEAAVGVMLLINPEGFTRTVIIILGALLLIFGIISMVRFIIAKREEESGILSLIGAIICLILGLIFTIFSQSILNLLMNIIPMIYAIILFIFGLNKLITFFVGRNSDLTISWLNLISGAIAVVLSVVIIVYPAQAAITVWMIAGIALLVEAVFDIISVIHTYSLMKKVNF